MDEWKMALIYVIVMISMIIGSIIVMGNYANGYKMAFVGDFDDNEDSLAVRNAIYRFNPNMVNLLGDMSYSHNDSFVKNKYFSVFSDLRCVTGNHDLKLVSLLMKCGEWYYNYDNTLVFGVNSENEIYHQAVNLVNLMDRMKPANVMVVSHRPCTDINMESLCDIAIVNNRINATLMFISGHKHICATSYYQTHLMLISGCGGAFHQSCSNPIYAFCNDVDYGFLAVEIKESGKIKVEFYDMNGKLLHKVKRVNN